MTEVDISETTIPKSDQINADHLRGGKTLTIKITNVTKVNDPQQPIVINYEGDNGLVYRPGKSMRRVLEQVWGRKGKDYIGRSLTLFCKEDVKFGGETKGGVRISHMSHIEGDKDIILTESRTTRKPFRVKPLKTSEVKAAPSIPPVGDNVEISGALAAAKGVSAYKKWLDTVKDEDRDTVKQHHQEWSKIAKEAGE